jgi:hypothetical protein
MQSQLPEHTLKFQQAYNIIAEQISTSPNSTLITTNNSLPNFSNINIKHNPFQNLMA